QTTVPELPAQDVPVQWLATAAEDTDIGWPQAAWWQTFGTSELDSLLAEVKQNNLDLASNRRNLESARLALAEAGVALLPAVDLTLGTGASYTETRTDAGQNTQNSGSPLALEAGLRYADLLSKP